MAGGCTSPVTVVSTLNGAHSVHAHGTGEWRVEPPLASQGLRSGAHQGTQGTMPLTGLESTDRGGPSAGSKEPLPLSGQAEVTLVPLSLVPPLEGSHISHPRSEEPHPRKLPGPGSPGNCFLGAEPTVRSGAS